MTFRAGETYDLEVPENVARVVRSAGGLNVYGEPLYRMVWGWQRLELRIGLHTDHDDHDNVIRRELRAEWWPRYHPRDRFHLEVWKPCEIYGSPEAWEEGTSKWVQGVRVPSLGPFPSRGEYEHVAVCQSQRGDFMWPTEDAVRELISWHQRAASLNKTQRRALADAQQEYEKESLRQKYRDIIDSEVRAFPFKTWVPVQGRNPRPLPGV